MPIPLPPFRIWLYAFSISFCFFSCSTPSPEARQASAVVAKPQTDSSQIHNADTSFTFAVDSVVSASWALQELSYKAAIEHKLEKKTLTFPEEKKDLKLVPCESNGFLQAVHLAYAEHRPLKLSPDAVWLLICQGFSIHANEQHKTLEPLLFKKQKPKTLSLRNDSLVNGKPAEWARSVSMLAAEVFTYTNDSLGKLMVPHFQATGPVEKSCYEITLLESAQKTFEYSMESGCGIPEITLTGAPEDWDWIYTHIDDLRKYKLDDWVDALKPVLHEFCEARKGRVNKAFWKVIYKDVHFYGRSCITGWILKFFPYISVIDLHAPAIQVGNPDDYVFQSPKKYIPNPFLAGSDYCLSDIKTENIPDGISKIDVNWTLFPPLGNEKREMKLYAGFIGIRQSSSSKALSPEISWAVAYKKSSAVVRQFPPASHQANAQKHRADLFLPYQATKVQAYPVYAPDKFNSYKESKAYLVQSLSDSLRKMVPDHKPVKVSFVVNWQGGVSKVTFAKETPEAVQRLLKSWLLHLPFDWKPAKSNEMSWGLEEPGVLYACNYGITLTIP